MFRLLLALAVQYGLDVDHMDVVMAFLNPKIDQDNIYMEMRLGIDWLAMTGRALTGSAWSANASSRSASTVSASTRGGSSGNASSGSASTGSVSTGRALILRKALYGLKQTPRL